jgi:hypothetical protein
MIPSASWGIVFHYPGCTWSQRDTHDAQIGRSALLRAQRLIYILRFKHRRRRWEDELYTAYTVSFKFNVNTSTHERRVTAECCWELVMDACPFKTRRRRHHALSNTEQTHRPTSRHNCLLFNPPNKHNTQTKLRFSVDSCSLSVISIQWHTEWIQGERNGEGKLFIFAWNNLFLCSQVKIWKIGMDLRILND